MKNQKLGWISCKCGSVSLKSSMFQTLELWTNIQLRAASKRQIFSENHSRFQRTSNREKLTLKFSTICSSLFLIRKSGFSMACGAELLICFLLSQYNHILLEGKRRRSGDKWIHLCEIWHPMSAPGLFWVLSELFTGAKLGSVGRLTNQRWGTLPVVSLVEKLPRTSSPNLVVGQKDGYGVGTHRHSTVRGGFPGKA